MRKILGVFAATLATALALVVGGSAAPASADEKQDRCDELATAMAYHTDKGNEDYVKQLAAWAGERGCDFGAVR